MEFRKRLDEKFLAEINEIIIEFNKSTDSLLKGGKGSKKPQASDYSSDNSSKDQPGDNRGTLIVDATCAPQNIRNHVEVERAFSPARRSFGMGLIRTRFEGTMRNSIVLLIIAMNIDKLAKAYLAKNSSGIFNVQLRTKGRYRDVYSL